MENVELRKRGVYLGRAGEDGRKRVCLDVTAWHTAYSAGTGVLLYTSPNGQTWPMGTTVEEDSGVYTMYGLVTAAETSVAGTGIIEARWVSGGVTVISSHYNTVVLESTYTGDTTTDNNPGWVKDLITELTAAGVLLDELGVVAAETRAAAENLETVGEEAAEAASDAEAWARGKRGGVDVDSDDEAYHKNARYYKDQAAASAASAALSESNAMSGTPTGYASIVAGIAPTYAANAAYTAGDYVIYNADLYRCIRSIAAAADWTTDSGCFVKVSVGQELAGQAESLRAGEAQMAAELGANLFIKEKVTAGYYLNASGVKTMGSAWTYSDFIPVEAGAEYTYKGLVTHSDTISIYLTYDADKTMVSTGAVLTTGGTITPAAGIAYLVFNVCQGGGDVDTFTLVKSGGIKETVEDSAEKVERLNQRIFRESLYNAAGNTDGYNLNGDTGEVQVGASYCVTDYMEVIAGDTYVYSGITFVNENRGKYFFYTEDKTPITPGALPVADAVRAVTAPDNARYVRFTLCINEDYEDQLTFNFRPLRTQGAQLLVVDKNGAADFTTICDAFAYACTIETEATPVTILIQPGTYDEVLECTSYNDGIYDWGKHVSFVGVSKNEVIWRDTSGRYKNSPLHTSNPCLIKGIRFEANHDNFSSETYATYHAWAAASGGNYGSYGLHLDDPRNGSVNTGEEYVTLVEDCYIRSEQHAAVGIGMRAGQTLILRNCVIETEIPEGDEDLNCANKGALLFHGAFGQNIVNPTTEQRLIVDNCTIIANGDYYLTGSYFNYDDNGTTLNSMTMEFLRNFFWTEKGTIKNTAAGIYPSYLKNWISEKSFGNNVSVLNPEG